MAKDKTPKSKAKGRKGGPAASEWPLISVSEHPRARRSIRRSKAWAGLLGFLLVGFLSYRAGVDPFEAVLRALVAGIVLYVVVWMASVALWQRIVLYEAKSEAERRRDAREEHVAALRAKQEAAAAGGEAAA